MMPKSVLANIDGQQDIKDVFKDLDAILQGKRTVILFGLRYYMQFLGSIV